MFIVAILARHFLKIIPQRFVRDGGHHLDALPRYGMNKRNGTGMQTNASILIGPGSPILQITFDGTSYVSQLAANLMMTTRLESHLQQIIIVTFGNYFKIECCFFGTFFILSLRVR